jgi:hypothetical protein
MIGRKNFHAKARSGEGKIEISGRLFFFAPSRGNSSAIACALGLGSKEKL